MKRLFSCVALSLVLTACGSDDKKVEAAPPKPVITNLDGQQEGVVCPVIVGGNYVREEREGNETRRFSLYLESKVEGGRSSYRMNKDEAFVLADGKANRIDNEEAHGSFAVTCDSTRVFVALQEDGKERMELVIKPTAQANVVNVTGTGDFTALNGDFTREAQ